MEAQPLNELYEQLTPEVVKRLSYIVNDLQKGKDEVVRTPFLKDLSPKEILASFYDEVYHSGKSSLNATLLELEENQKEKFGPRSIQKPWSERKSSLLATFAPKDVDFKMVFPLQVKGHGLLRPVSLDRAKRTLKRTTSSGLPYMLSKGMVLDGNLEITLGKDWPCVLFTRTQEGGKTRTVWGYPITITLLEALYFTPYFNSFMEHGCFAAYSGPDAVDKAISDLLHRKEKDHVVYSEDFSNFDQSIASNWSYRTFNSIRQAFQGCKSIDGDFDTIANYFVSCGVITPDGVISGNHGIPSGSTWTSIVGSFCHLEVQNAVRKVEPHLNQVMGDDGVSVHPPTVTSETLADVYADYNLEFNKDKTFTSKDEVLYLQRYYSDDYKVRGVHRGIYPVYRALNRLIHMERWTNVTSISGAEYFAIRTIAILENCKWHPLHESFVKWVWQNDKYNLQYTSQGLREYIGKFQPRTLTTIKNQYSDDLTGIESFETVKILKKL